MTPGMTPVPRARPPLAAAETPRRPRRRLQSRPRRRHPARRRRAPPPGHGHHRLPRPARPARTHSTGDAAPDRTQPGRHRSQPATSLPPGQPRRSTPERCSSPDPSPPPPSGRSPATPTSSPSSSAAKAGSWTSAAPHGSSRPTSAKPSPPATRAAPSPAAPSPPPGAKPTTSPTGPTADTTGTENGTLLCSHHHHVIHKEHWTIQIRTGIPWFIPPPHIDPRQKPRRNYYFHPADLGHAA